MMITVDNCVSMVCLLLYYKPYSEPLLLRLEIVNEVTNWLLFMHVYMLTDLPLVEGCNIDEIHDTVSWFFLKIIVWNLLIHFYFLSRSFIQHTIRYCKYRVIPRMKTKKEVLLPMKVEEVVEEFSSYWEYYSEEEEEE